MPTLPVPTMLYLMLARKRNLSLNVQPRLNAETALWHPFLIVSSRDEIAASKNGFDKRLARNIRPLRDWFGREHRCVVMRDHFFDQFSRRRIVAAVMPNL